MTRPRVSPPALAALLLSSAVCLAEAQQLQSTWQVPQTVAADESAPRHGAAAPFLSVILPGAGQYRLGQTRWIAYAALEAAGWLWFRDRRASGLDFEARYRDLAWDVARTGTTGVRRDGDFHYYEALARYERSGAFDADATRAGVQPETDPSTYNGALWALARAMFFPAGADSLPVDSPEYARALEYYVERAVAAEFSWSWAGNAAARARYRELMSESDEALRSATRTLGLILANHLVSAVDALVSTRLRARRATPPPFEFESDLRVRGREATWSATIHVPWPGR